MFTGVYVANVTPFRTPDEVDVDAYVAHVRWLAGKRVDGVVPFGTNGEGPSCSMAEKMAVMRAVVEADLGIELIPAVMEGNLPATLQLIEAYNELPLGGIMVLPPYYFRPAAAEGLHQFFREAVSASRHPVVLYHIPKYAEPVPWRSIAELPAWGIKNSAGDKALTERVLAAGKGVLLGTEDDLWGHLETGAPGMISALANFAPELLTGLHRHHRNGERQVGQALSERLQRVRAMTRLYAPTATLKRLAGYRNGINMGTFRPPLVAADDLDQEAILREAGLA